MVRLDRLSGKKFIAHWFDPRTGAATPASEHDVVYQKRFVPPDTDSAKKDWVLVLDDAPRNFSLPGSTP